MSERTTLADPGTDAAPAVGLVRLRLPAWLPFGPVVLPWLVSRLLATGSLILGGSASLGRLTAAWLTSWDGAWYLKIAQFGYGPPPVSPGVQTPWPFFPLLPGVVRAFDEVGIPDRFAIVALNHAVFLVALAGVWRLTHDRFGARAATWATWALALFPISIVFSMGYPSSVFLAASAWAFVWAGRGRFALAGAIALVATAVRPNGVIVAAVLAVAVLVGDGATRWSPVAWRRAVVIGAPSALFLAGWCALCWHWTGDPFVFWTTKAAWDERTVLEFVSDPENGGWPHAITGSAGIAAVVLWWRRLPAAWLAFAALYLGPPLVLGIIGLGRYANECFPVMAAAGGLLERIPAALARVALVVSAAGMVLFGVMVSRYRYLP